MTEMITYEHSNGVTIDLRVMKNSFSAAKASRGDNLFLKENKGASVVNDPNRVGRMFRFNAWLTTAQTVTMITYVQPAAALAYDDYPRFSVIYVGDATTETNVKVKNVDFNYHPIGRDVTDLVYLWTFAYAERF